MRTSYAGLYLFAQTETFVMMEKYVLGLVKVKEMRG